MYICSEDKDTILVAETCGKYWDRYPRKREQLIKEVKVYKDLKKGSEVMLPVKKNGVMTWALGTVSFLYEDGSISVMEYYTNPGRTGGTLSYTYPYANIARKDAIPASADNLVCAKDAFEISYGPTNSRKYTFEKGEALTVKEIFNNGMMSVSYIGFMKNFFSYGKDSKLPVPQDKVGPCAPSEIAVDDSKREAKPAAEIAPSATSQRSFNIDR